MRGYQIGQSAIIKRTSKPNEKSCETFNPFFWMELVNFRAKVAVPPISLILNGRKIFISLEDFSFEFPEPFRSEGNAERFDDESVFFPGTIVETEVPELGFDALKHLSSLVFSARRQSSFDVTRTEKFRDICEGRFREKSEPEVVILPVANGFVIFSYLLDEICPEDDAAVSEWILSEDRLPDFGIRRRWGIFIFTF